LEQQLRTWLRAHHGIIGRAEVLQLGGSDHTIRSKLRRGEWDSPYSGVYHHAAAPLTPHGALRAAVLAAGPAAVASHSSAAWLWGLRDHPPPRPELSTPASSQHGCHEASIVIHRSRDLHRARPSERHGIPTTNPLRVLVDLGASPFCEGPDDLAAALDRGLTSKLVTIGGLQQELQHISRRGRPGPGPLRRLLDDRGYLGVAHPSVLESKTLRLFRLCRLPVPDVEFTTGPDGEYRLEFAFPPLKLAVEVDGYVHHFSADHARRDNARRNQLQRQGWLILVYTWRDVLREPTKVVPEIGETSLALTTLATTEASRPA
jgi:very-short-patch-repair endonuclease